MNKYNLSVQELGCLLKSHEFDTDRKFYLKDNAFDYDLDGFLRSIEEDTRKFDFIWDDDTIKLDNKTICKFKLQYEDPRDNW